jgi:oligopeptide/dipeptide ABC transporter ATP-binding protein
MTALVDAKHVEVWFSADGPPAVAGVDIEIAEGAAVGIVGESGSGKTTLGRVLVGALEPTHGEVLVEGRPWSAIDRRNAARRTVQMIFQDPYGSLNPWLTARTTVGEVIRVWESVNKREAERRAGELLAEVGLSRDAMDRRPSRLSGGECQRVGIARALACNPRLLVADEPTSSLDVSVQGQILNLLASLRETRGLALVLISHDLAVVHYTTDEANVMYAGHVVERGATEDLLTRPSHPYTRILVDAIPGREGETRAVDNEVDAADGCVFASRCPFVGTDCVAAQPPLVAWSDRDVACVRPLSASLRSETPARHHALAPEAAAGTDDPTRAKHPGRGPEAPPPQGAPAEERRARGGLR